MMDEQELLAALDFSPSCDWVGDAGRCFAVPRWAAAQPCRCRKVTLRCDRHRGVLESVLLRGPISCSCGYLVRRVTWDVFGEATRG
ncbi:hypothetical protein L332_03455 [Agrococcus pavilionensis RW1]|uniref:Uncharacterized protein n=1 Tax=Agrococcus pavilionensis RW1 TaxID=1330458 RepID=U1LNH0_9MICO|nr:hypothetical protein [Agrococcus pavilionensis]ERG63512.1 hypothetical protein L332_03455 [Agrococcus pavilionensis RW1]